MNEIEKMRAFGSLAWLPGADALGHRLRDAALVTNGAIGRLAEFEATLAEAERRLKPEALSEEKRRLGQAALDDLAKLTAGALGNARQGWAEARAGAAPRLPELEPAALAVRQVAIWGLLPQSALEMTTAYRDAVAAEDDVVISAIESLPHFAPGALASDQLAELRGWRFGRENPDAARQLGELERAAHDAENALRVAREEIETAAGLSEAEAAAAE